MSKAPHLVQYQGSKRSIAPEILKYFPDTKIKRFIEPFSGTCAMTILAAMKEKADSFNALEIGKRQKQLTNSLKPEEGHSFLKSSRTLL